MNRRVGKSRFHPSRIPGHEKFRRTLEANKKVEPLRAKPKLFSTVSEAFTNGRPINGQNN